MKSIAIFFPSLSSSLTRINGAVNWRDNKDSANFPLIYREIDRYFDFSAIKQLLADLKLRIFRAELKNARVRHERERVHIFEFFAWKILPGKGGTSISDFAILRNRISKNAAQVIKRIHRKCQMISHEKDVSIGSKDLLIDSTGLKYYL